MKSPDKESLLTPSNEERKILEKYFPEASIDQCYHWIRSEKLHFTVKGHRESKRGDYRTDHKGTNNRITVNGTLNPFSFHLTFVHELAHHFAYQKYGRHIRPHGQEWKHSFRELMLEVDLPAVYPEDVIKPLLQYLLNPLASTDRHTALSMALKRYDQNNDYSEALPGSVHICDLKPGMRFRYNGERFVVVKKRRRLYLCQQLDGDKHFLFQPHADVIPL